MEMLLLIAALICALYVFSVRGRTGHPGLAELRKWKYAHRGLHNASRPENSMSAFRAALEKGYGIELDVHLLRDGNLAVMHDSNLKRTTGEDIRIEDLTTEQLGNYHLQGTSETIPTFQQVLDLFAGKAPLIVELKVTGGNHAALCEKVCAMLDGYNGPFCIESFDPRAVLWLKQHRPDLIRGQLTENFFASNSSLPWFLKFILTHQIENFLTLPDFVAYRYCDRRRFSNTLVRKLWGVEGVTWTLRSLEEVNTAVEENWIPIFENCEP